MGGGEENYSVSARLGRDKRRGASATDMKTLYLNHIRSSCGSNTNLPSIISRSKENEFHSNGCTQRIRPYERNTMDGEFSLSKEPNDKYGKRKVKDDEEDKSIIPAHTYIIMRRRSKAMKKIKVFSQYTDENSKEKVKGDEEDKSILPAHTDENSGQRR